MLQPQGLTGAYPAIITPLIGDGDDPRIDFDGFTALIAHIIESGCSGVVIAGTTGQSAVLDHAELLELCRVGTEFARAFAAKRKHSFKVICSAGSNATKQAIAQSRDVIRAARPDALLHVSGYYNNPPQEGLVRHFTKVADACAEEGTPVILYNVPSRTNSNLQAASCIALSRHPGIIAVKEASGDLDQVEAILKGTDPDEFTVVSGEDGIVADIMKLGGRGVISASANRWPREFQVLTELAAAGRHEEAAELQDALMPCVRAVFAAKNPIPLHAMFRTGLRSPLVALDELNDPARQTALNAINDALAIESFPHVPRLENDTESPLDFDLEFLKDSHAMRGEAVSL